MQFHFPQCGKWKWKRVNIPICLITSYYWGLFALATPMGGNWDAHTHTEHHFPHFAGTNPKHLSLQDPRFHFKAGMGHPKARKQPQVINFGGGGCPGNDPAGLFFPTHCYSPLWKSGWARGFPPTFSRLKTFIFILIILHKQKHQIYIKTSVSIYFFFPRGKQAKKMNCRKVSSAMCTWTYGIFWMRAEAGKPNSLVLKAVCCCLNDRNKSGGKNKFKKWKKSLQAMCWSGRALRRGTSLRSQKSMATSQPRESLQSHLDSPKWEGMTQTDTSQIGSGWCGAPVGLTCCLFFLNVFYQKKKITALKLGQRVVWGLCTSS